MQDLKTAGIDWMRTRSSQSRDVGGVDIVVALPRSMSSVEIHDLLSRVGDIPPERRPKDLDAMRQRWCGGQAMTAQELPEYRPLVPPGSFMVGWRSIGCIPPHNYTGFAMLMPKSAR